MTNPASTPEAASARPAPNRQAVLIATGFGLGHAPVAPGTAGSLAAVVVFVPLLLGLDNPFIQLFYVFLLVGIALVGLWSAEQALPHWGTGDPQAVVIDEILGQWLSYGGLVLAAALGRPPASRAAGWIYLLVGFILFRAFDVLKPFPIRHSERLPGASGVLLDDALAGIYAGLGLLLLAWTGWLS